MHPARRRGRPPRCVPRSSTASTPARRRPDRRLTAELGDRRDHPGAADPRSPRRPAARRSPGSPRTSRRPGPRARRLFMPASWLGIASPAPTCWIISPPARSPRCTTSRRERWHDAVVAALRRPARTAGAGVGRVTSPAPSQPKPRQPTGIPERHAGHRRHDRRVDRGGQRRRARRRRPDADVRHHDVPRSRPVRRRCARRRCGPRPAPSPAPATSPAAWPPPARSPPGSRT